MSVELTDLRVWECSSRCVRIGAGTLHAEHEYNRIPTASEVASACPTEVLIAVLVERGVLTIDHNVKWDDLGLVVEVRFVSDWTPGEPVAGGVS